MRTYSYFELTRGTIYSCSLDSNPNLFEYKLYKHYLVYRKTNGLKDKWTGVWNIDWYNEQKASYTIKKI